MTKRLHEETKNGDVDLVKILLSSKCGMQERTNIFVSVIEGRDKIAPCYDHVPPGWCFTAA